MSVSSEFFCAETHPEWRTNFNAAKQMLEEELFHAHPMVMQMNVLFESKCSKLSFFRQLDDYAFPIDQELFHQVQHAQIRYAAEVLQSQLVVEARAIFLAVPEHKWIKPALLYKFLMCVRKVMSLHLTTLLFKTLHAVLLLFDRFESNDDDSAIFILNLIVDQNNCIRYDPEPQETLHRIASLLELVKDAICSVPVIRSDLVSIQSYASLNVVSSHEADVMLQEAKVHLADIYRQKMKCPENLLAKFIAYEFVLSEPDCVFPSNWYVNQVWKGLVPEWQRVFKRSRQLKDEIEVLAKDEEDVGIFVVITSGPAKYNLVTEVLVNKALSIGDRVKKIIVDCLKVRTDQLRKEYEWAHAICTTKSDEPKKLLELVNAQKQIKSKLIQWAVQAKDLEALHEVLIENAYLLEDTEAFSLFRCSYLAAVLPRMEDEARTYLSEVSHFCFI